MGKKKSLVGYVEKLWKPRLTGSKGYEWYRIPTVYKKIEEYRSPIKVRLTIEEIGRD